jgi:hypothetical protein
MFFKIIVFGSKKRATLRTHRFNFLDFLRRRQKSTLFLMWRRIQITKIYCFHSNSKFRVSATKAFRETSFTEVSSSKILLETSGFLTETSGFRTKTSDFSNRNFGFLNRNFMFPTRISCFWKPEINLVFESIWVAITQIICK